MCVEPGADGLVYVSDHRVKVLTKGGQFVRFLGQFGSDNVQFAHPRGVAVDSNRVFVAEQYNHRVQVFAKDDGHYVRTIGVTGEEGGSGNHQLNEPWGVCVEPGPAGRLFVCDVRNHRVQVLTKDGAYVRTIGVTGQEGRGNHQLS